MALNGSSMESLEEPFEAPLFEECMARQLSDFIKTS